MGERHSNRAMRRDDHDAEVTSVHAPHLTAGGWRRAGAAIGAVALAAAGAVAVFGSTAAATPTTLVDVAAPQRAPLPLAAVTAVGAIDHTALDKRVESLSAEADRIVAEKAAARAAAEAAARAEKVRAEKAAQWAAAKAAKKSAYAHSGSKDHGDCADKWWGGN